MTRNKAHRGDSNAPILILSAIDLLLAALTAAFGLMLVLSTASTVTGQTRGANAGDVASSILVELESSQAAPIKCNGSEPWFTSFFENFSGPVRADTLLLPARVTRLHCTRDPSRRSSGGDMTVILADGATIKLRFTCPAGATNVIDLDLRPGNVRTDQRVLGGSCDRKIVKDPPEPSA